MLLRLLSFLLILGAALNAAPLQDGDRIVLLGDSLFETERHTGALEGEIHQRFPKTSLTLRNLSWSGDTPGGLSRASFDPAPAGMQRIREHLELTKPTIAILGYGMAASLQELTEQANDWTLNPDPQRYGTMTAERFRQETDSLIKLIKEVSGKDTRIIIVAPIEHEDLRKTRPHTPDPSAHNEILKRYTKALRKLATAHNLEWFDSGKAVNLHNHIRSIPPATKNGIHLTDEAYERIMSILCHQLDWKSPGDTEPALHQAILAKSDAFFHRYRPANATYLFGFRKHEQGQNAKEMVAWDEVIAKRDAAINAIKNGTAPTDSLAAPKEEPKTPVLSAPSFTVPEGYEISLWAEAPLVRKPVAMNWDQGNQLWVTSAPIYPQIQPDKFPEDKIYILADKDGDGKAESSTVFADDLLIPTGIAPVPAEPGTPSSACYVGASTEILLLTDTDNDGKADQRQVILSGFGTEDTHHNVHTLRWGPDGRLYFNQSIYTHSHMETPHGMIRLNGGGVLSYNPDSERVEVFSKGFVNSWGHAWNREGQSFLTDGAGFKGLAWAFPGTILNASEGAQRSMPTISPGSYPKYAGLELIDSPIFPDDWQDTAVTGDFRAHRVVRFKIQDLSPKHSGYITQELEPLVVTSDVAFRPIDIKHGADGALYIADWTNPIINHGEVDFRDPRRDQSNGRIWRLTRKDAPAIKWTPTKRPLARSSDPAKDAASDSPRRRIEAMRTLARTPSAESAVRIIELAAQAPADDPYYEFAAWRSTRDVGSAFVETVRTEGWDWHEERRWQFNVALQNLSPTHATEALSILIQQMKPSLNGSGPWFTWIGSFGGPEEVQQLFESLTTGVTATPGSRARALTALLGASERGIHPQDLTKVDPTLFQPASPDGLRLISAWKLNFTDVLEANLRSTDELRNAAFAALGELRTEEAIAILTKQLTAKEPKLRHHSLSTLANFRPDLALKALPPIATELGNNPAFWQPLFAHQGFLNKFTKAVPTDWDPAVYKAALEAARKQGRKGTALVRKLEPLAGNQPVSPSAQNNKSVAAVVRAAKQGGDPADGELIYRRPELACTLCHAIGGVGGKLGPDMTSLGASAPVDYIVESLIHPERKVKEGYHAVSYTLTNGNTLIGIPSRSTPTDQFIRTATGEQAIPKDTIKSQKLLGAGGSLMPGGLLNSLNHLETRSLIHFLQQLGRPGPYDASNGSIARLWTIHPANKETIATSPEASPGGTPLPTFVDGRITADLLKPLLANRPAVFAQSRFVTTTEGEVHLKLEGIREAWLNGTALPIASEPGRKPTLPAGTHTLTIKLSANDLPPHFRASCPEARFLTE